MKLEKYHDLEDSQPKENGFYKVKIQRENENTLIEEATWEENEFVLTKYELQDSDYIFAWRKSEKNNTK